MHRRRPPLLARLRHRLATSVWVLTFLVMSKLVGASMFHIDGVDLGSSASSDSAVQVVVVDAGPHDDASDVDDNADDDGPCWHAGVGGCHCSAAHGVPLPIIPLLTLAPVSRDALPTAIKEDFPPAPQHTMLRPPIARLLPRVRHYAA